MEEHTHTLNLDVTEFASGHTDFKQRELGLHLKSEFSQLDSGKQQQLYLASQ